MHFMPTFSIFKMQCINKKSLKSGTREMNNLVMDLPNQEKNQSKNCLLMECLTSVRIGNKSIMVEMKEASNKSGIFDCHL